ncbi:MAG: hypothetical protein IT162_23065 [Bryobacterales bacterium]|nr:hypothetical protein [Bryobacterales bacterium]
MTAALTAQSSRPLDMKMLVLSADGTEPSFEAIKTQLAYMAVPYEAVVLRNQPLPALAANGKGNYQGILLSTGSLSYNNGSAWVSALTAANWTTLETYMRDYKVRLASFYTFPEARFGLRYINAVSTSDTAPGTVTMSTAGRSVFDYLNPSASIKVIFSYTYLAASAPATGESTTPLLSMNNSVVGATHRKADGREYLALTMDQSSNLNHSLALHYGVINWVTRGVFIGMRRVYVIPQNDDVFLNSTQFQNTPNCRPALVADPTVPLGVGCPERRITGADLSALATWQSRVRSNGQYRYFKVAHAFNGFGATAAYEIPNDTLVTEARRLRSTFNWLSHTFTHENLDCYLPADGSGICAGATYAQTLSEIDQNRTVSANLGLSDDRLSMVTPGISGLNNQNFLNAFAARGMRYLVTDTSKPGGLPAVPNTAIMNPLQSSVVMIPRRATNIFFNTSTPTVGANGSETDEYNYMFGPNGIFRIGGPGGAPFFTTTQTYNQIIERESDAIVTYMLRGELYPLMFHQANYWRYNGVNSLFTDLMDAVFRKWTAISKLQVGTLKQATVGARLKARLDLLTAGVKGVYTPGVGVTLTATRNAEVPVTGVCSSLLGCEAVYNGQRQDHVSVSAGRSVSLPYYSFDLPNSLSEDK